MQVIMENQSQPVAKVMNLSRLQICLNSEDPSVLKLGLKLFSDKVLEDHYMDDIEYGVIASVQQLFGEKATIPIHGVLDALLKSSPKLEELFAIWTDIEMSISLDPEVCIQYLRCFIVILRCCPPSISTGIATRILQTHESSLQKLLESKVELVASLTHLIIAECLRRHRSLSDEISSCLFLPRKQAATEQSYQAEHIHQRIIALFTILQHAEPKTVLKLLQRDRIFISLIQHTNSHQTIATMLNGILTLLETNVFIRNHVEMILTKPFFEVIAHMSTPKTENSQHSENSTFAVEKATMAIGMLTVFARVLISNEFGMPNIEKLKVNFLESLTPFAHLQHQEILLQLCNHDVSMISKCISALRVFTGWNQANVVVLAWKYLLKLLQLFHTKNESTAYTLLIPISLTTKDIEEVLTTSSNMHDKVEVLQIRVHCLQYLQLLATIAVKEGNIAEVEFGERLGCVTLVKLLKMRNRYDIMFLVLVVILFGIVIL